jgi:hypothetical protein
LLISPAEGEILNNIKGHRSEFYDWTDVPGATKYHLYVRNSNAINLSIDIETTQSYYKEDRDGYVANKNRLNWYWEVSAYANGEWYKSSQNHFSYAPLVEF